MLKRSIGRTILLVIFVMAGEAAAQVPPTDVSGLSAAPVSFTPEQVEFFEARIRPVLVEHCYSCHSAEAKELKGRLRLDSRDAVLNGGDSGPSLVAGNPEVSLLMQALRHDGLEMPPDRKLPENVLSDFATWIRAGAADPRSGGSGSVNRTIDIEKGREFWSFCPVVKPEIPVAGEGWATNDVDRFVAALHEQQVVADDAAPEVLIRRLTFVLTGLPPSLDEQAQFAKAWIEDQDRAMEVAVDRLLASPRFGERWGRHWLDVARFAESTGGGRSMMLPDAWRFRDYVIGSFNEDKPFDQLIREHIAGDLLPSTSEGQHDSQLTGVGYLMLGAINYEEQDKAQLRMDVVDEQIDSMGRTFLGMTLGCARCHDHKFDPVPTADYYALAGIFRSTTALTPGNVSGFMTAPLRTGFDKAALATWTAKDQELEQQIVVLKKATGGPIVRSGAPASPESASEKKAELKRLEAERQLYAKVKPVIPGVMCVQDDPQPADWHVHIRGEIRNLGAVVPRGFLQAATAKNETATLSPMTAGTSGRRELADWIASPSNPLTARVYVNRVWKNVMGEGLVRTPDNFGETGDRPTHPELLDFLASAFVTDDAWSTKTLIRRLCLSRTFRMASTVSAASRESDPGNLRLTHAFRRRLEAECVRDSLLQISGNLDLTVQSGRTIGKLGTYDNEYSHAAFPLKCRSVYVPAFRNTMLDLFEVFDVANPNLVTGLRNRSTRPAQALYLLNSPFVMQQARSAAAAFLKSPAYDVKDSESSIRNAWRLCTSRTPVADELAVLFSGVAKQPDSEESWTTVFHAMFASVEFRYLE